MGRTGLGLQIKSVLVLTCVIVAVVAAGGWYYYRAVREMVWRNNYIHAEQLGKALSFAAETDLRDKRWDCLDDLTRDLVRFEKNSVPYVAIVDAEGNVVSSAVRSGQTEPWQRLFRAGPSKLNLSRHNGRYVLITRPIISRDKVWLKERLAGGVRMVLDISETKQALVQAKQKILYAAVWIAFFAIPLGYVLINRVLVHPIRRLVHVTRRLAGGDFQARSGLNRRDEVGVLAVAMDDMAAEVTRKRNELLASNERLERKVVERTEELQGKNELLEESMLTLREMAITDALTHLANRRYFNEQLARQFSQASRYDEDLSCCMIDLDHYKEINDTLGHQLGDEVLKITAEEIQAALRDSDVAARYGGDEFVLLLPETSIEDALEVAGRIRIRMARALQKDKRLRVPITVSIGVASLRRDTPQSAEGLVSMADRALYCAKDLGKDRIIAFHQMREQTITTVCRTSNQSAPRLPNWLG